MISFLDKCDENLIDNIFYFLYNLVSDPNNKLYLCNIDYLIDNLLKSMSINFDNMSINILGA